ncbi:MAG: helix-turn-helix transcriptional regulator, partial [Candidatus Pacebacteria bacterium]|nr:helix-turn-helix transcriptional regulator [Candidatus Paceibacterota bacterium]
YQEFGELRDLNYIVGERIKEARKKAGLTQRELAKKMGTLQPSVARAENGSVSLSQSFLFRVAKALNTELVPPTFTSIETIVSPYTVSDLSVVLDESEQVATYQNVKNTKTINKEVNI